MRTVPEAGEVWFIDLGMVGKPRYALVLAAQTDARLALASLVLIAKQFEDTPYKITLPRVPWLREQSYITLPHHTPAPRPGHPISNHPYFGRSVFCTHTLRLSSCLTASRTIPRAESPPGHSPG